MCNDGEKPEFEADLPSSSEPSPLLPEKIVLEKILSNDDEDDDDDDGGGLHECASDPVWIIYNRHVLHLSDKMIIESGELSDKHILMAQYYIKKQLPLIGGLHSTLL